MKKVFKYNLFKSLSLLVTCVPSFLVTAYYGDFIIRDSKATISFAGVMSILVAVLFLKNKIAENFKVPSPFIVACVLFFLTILIEHILLQVKMTCLVIMISTGIDELSFKRIYKSIEVLMPEKIKAYKHLGFYICKSDKLKEFADEQD